MMTSEEFVTRLTNVVKYYKTLYVMGCFGSPLTGSNVDKYCNNHDYNKQSSRTRMIKSAGNQTPPVFGFDCVCLIKGILWGWTADASKPYGGANYGSNGVPDVSADGMILKCTGVSTAGWSEMLIGEALWCEGHIGVYIGNGLAVECTPSWDNKVQITAVGNIGNKDGYHSRKWKKHGKLPYITYSKNTPLPSIPGKKVSNTATKPVSLKVGDKVKVAKGAKSYSGASLASFIYSNVYVLREIKGDRAVIAPAATGSVTAAVKLSNLHKA